MLLQLEEHYKQNFTTLVKRIAFRCENNFHDAEDVVQEAYFRAIKYKETFAMGLSFENWFSRILSNALKDFKREKKAMGTVEEVDESHFEPMDDPSIPSEVWRKIHKEISLLQQPKREIVELGLVYGYSIPAIVQVTNTKYKEIENILLRFKAAMREKYME